MQALRDWATRDEKRKAHWWAIPTHVETDQQPSKPRSLLEAFLSVQCSAAPSHALRLPMIRRPSHRVRVRLALQRDARDAASQTFTRPPSLGPRQGCDEPREPLGEAWLQDGLGPETHPRAGPVPAQLQRLHTARLPLLPAL